MQECKYSGLRLDLRVLALLFFNALPLRDHPDLHLQLISAGITQRSMQNGIQSISVLIRINQESVPSEATCCMKNQRV